MLGKEQGNHPGSTVLPGHHKQRDWCCRATPECQEEFWVLSALAEVTAVSWGGHGMAGIKFTLGWKELPD